MVAFYVLRIQQQKMAIDEVPDRWREAVRAALGLPPEEPPTEETTKPE